MEQPDRVRTGIQSDQRILGGDGRGFDLDLSSVGDNFTCHDQSELILRAQEIFDVSGFERAVRPLLIGTGSLSGVPTGHKISSLPIKFPDTEYRVPQELEYLQQLLQQCAAFEHQANPDIRDYYAYLTIHCSLVRAGTAQRGPVIHSDGIQGPRVQPKQPLERGYLLVDQFPPRFYVQAFKMDGINPDLHLMEPVFAAQADPKKVFTPPVDTLVAFDSYSVHQAVEAEHDGRRSFFRITYSTREYDRTGNSINKLFAQEYRQHEWEFQPRPLPEQLIDPLDQKINRPL